MINQTVTSMLKQMSIFEEMLDQSFRSRAYENAAQAIESLDKDLAEIYKAGGIKALEEIPGVGPSIGEKIVEYIKTKKIKELTKLQKQFPVNVEELREVEGLGPKKIKLLWDKLKIKNLADLEAAATKHKIASIPRLGAKSEANILRGITFLRATGNRKILGYILPLARTIEDRLKKLPGVTHAVVAGSIRRRQETIGDIDILVTTTKPHLAHEAFIKMPEVISVYKHGKTGSSVRLNAGLDADLRVTPPESFGAALQYFTGDKAHNVELRKIAIKKGFKLNEYGLYRGKKLIACHTEEEVYQALGMDIIPPEIRTNSGEIEAAIQHKLPDLIPYGSVRGDLQVQTNWTDAEATIEEMAKTAMTAGLEYIAITDHTKNLAFAGGLNEKKMLEQGKKIDVINKQIAAGKFGAENKEFKILKSAEVDVLKDGSLDLSDDCLKTLDTVSIAVHTNFKLSKTEQTARIIKALSHPLVDLYFHPTCRLINKRPPIEFDMDAIIAAAKKYRVALEINAYPDRTDLNGEQARKAIAAGVKLVIDTDAHAPEHYKFLELGEAAARRGWAEKKDVLNTLPVEKLLAYFNSKP